MIAAIRSMGIVVFQRKVWGWAGTILLLSLLAILALLPAIVDLAGSRRISVIEIRWFFWFIFALITFSKIPPGKSDRPLFLVVELHLATLGIFVYNTSSVVFSLNDWLEVNPLKWLVVTIIILVNLIILVDASCLLRLSLKRFSVRRVH